MIFSSLFFFCVCVCRVTNLPSSTHLSIFPLLFLSFFSFLFVHTCTTITMLMYSTKYTIQFVICCLLKCYTVYAVNAGFQGQNLIL